MSTTPENQAPLDITAAITRLRPGPGDVVVIRTTHAMGRAKAEKMRRIVGDMLAGTGARALILPEVSSITVVDEQQAKALAGQD